MVDDHTVVGRTIAILDAVVEAIAPIPLAGLTRQTGIPKQTVRRIADDLVARGMLERSEEGYLPGQRLMHHGLLSAHRHGVALTVQPYLQDLHLRSRGQAVWFATIHHGELILAGAAFGRSYAAPMAKSWFPTMSKLGASRVLLAAGAIEVADQPELADQILNSGCSPLTRHSVTNTRRLRSLVEQVRDTGFAHEVEQAVLGMSCMAAALRGSSGQLMGVIGLTGRRSAMEAPALRNAVRHAGESLVRDLRPASDTPVTNVWNMPIVDRHTGIGYTWPLVNEPPPEPAAPVDAAE
jgi:DNA-binding IclR family transcriptional regulator